MDKQKESERRRFIRHPFCFPLAYTTLSESSSGQGQVQRSSSTIDISEGGLLFSAKQEVKLNSLIRIKLPFQDKIFSVKARVLHCNRSAEANLYNIGVCFEKYNDAFKVKLVEQMYLISEYRDLRSMQLGKEISLQEASQEWISRFAKRFKRLYW